MSQEEEFEPIILCSASSYTKMFYLNPQFRGLPQRIQDELKIACVLFVADVSGIILLAFNEEGHLDILTRHDTDDIFYDEIGSELKMKQLQMDKRELFEQLEQFYDLFFLGNED